MATFSKTQSIGVFASINSINKIDLVINPHTGKTFGSHLQMVKNLG